MGYGGSGGGGGGSIAGSSDVALNSPSDGQVLAYDADTAKWKNQVSSSVPYSDRVMYGSNWPSDRPDDYGKPLVWDDTALALSQGSDTSGPNTDLLSVGDYWDTYRFEA